jgi:16S rRNA (uracil1498-N3)-methyltransferase
MAEPHRFFVPAATLATEPVTITGEALHHLRTVLRLGQGDEVLLLDGTGCCCRVRLEIVGRTQAEATVLARWAETEAPCPLRLLQALPKGDKFELVLQKGTELGITIFQPLHSSRTVTRPESSRQCRWERIVSEAARQSRRPRRPRLEPVRSLADALATVTEPLRLVFWEASARPLAEVLPAAPPAGVALLVGPEGGFAADEVMAVEAAGFVPAHLGPRILRTETAGLAVTAVLQYLYGDWHQPARHGGDSPGG